MTSLCGQWNDGLYMGESSANGSKITAILVFSGQ